MSILNVEHLSHGFGDRAIFSDVSFRLLKGEHIGLVGANGEGKSTFMNIITGKLMPDEGKVEWSKNVRVGYTCKTCRGGSDLPCLYKQRDWSDNHRWYGRASSGDHR